MDLFADIPSINQSAGGGLFDDIPKAQPSPKQLMAKQSEDILNRYLPQTSPFSEGVKSGATFGVLGKQTPEQAMMNKSLVNENGQPKDFGEKYGRQIGQVVGSAVPIIASEYAAGASLASLVAKYGMGPLQEAIAGGMLTGGVYGAAEGAAQNKPIPDTLSNIGKKAGTFGVASILGYGLGKFRNWLGNSVPESETQYFLGTPQRMAEKLQEQNKPSLAEQVLTQEPKLQGLKTRAEVRNTALDELEKEKSFTDQRLGEIQDSHNANLAEGQNEVQNLIANRANEMQTPNVPEVNVPENQRALPYNPTPVHSVEPQTILGKINTLKDTGLHGERVLLPPKIETTQPGGAKYQTLAGGAGYPPDYSGVGTQPTSPPSNFKQMAESVSNVPQRGIALADREFQPIDTETPIKSRIQGSSVDLPGMVNDAVDSLKQQYMGKTGTGNAAKAAQVQKWANDFLQGKDELTDLQTANEIRQNLDNEVGKAYLANSDAKLSPKIDAQMAVANEIRRQMSDLAPDVAKSLERQHRLLNVITSLSPHTAKSGVVRDIGWLKSPVVLGAGSEANYALAQGLRNTLGQPNEAANAVARTGGRLGISQMIDNYKRNGKLKQ